MPALKFTYKEAQPGGEVVEERLEFSAYQRAKAAFITHLNFAQNNSADLTVFRNHSGETISFTHDSQTVEGRVITVELEP